MPPTERATQERAHLRADCERCFALCCVAPALTASADFAIDKPAGRPCPNLRADFRCSIHDRLRQRGFPGCTAYDCFGAGQRVAQVTFGGRDWRSAPDGGGEMFAVFGTMRQLHELLWYLTEALALRPATRLRAALRDARDDTERLAAGTPQDLLGLDLDAHRGRVDALLLRVSEQARAGLRRRDTELRGADLIGRRLRGADLRGANLRGAYLVGADLAGADLHLADVIGTDLRGADVRGANLATALFLTDPQIAAATGDAHTTLPSALRRPAHWSAVLA